MTLQHLDSLIGFAVVMVGVSLLILILTQMISSLFGLRGTNLKWGLQVLLQTIDPRFENQAKEIAQQVLRHPLISDSAFSGFKEKMERIPILGRLFRRWKLASAIRPEELVTILQKLSAGKSIPDESILPANWTSGQIIKKLLENFDPQAGQSILVLAKQAKDIDPIAADKVKQFVQQITTTAQKSIGNMEGLFNSAMDRASQRFALHTRLWTVLFSVLVAFALHLDAFRLLTQLSADAEFRASLLTHADALSKDAEHVLSPNAGGTSQDEIKARLEDLKNQAGSIKSDLDQTKFQLVPSPYHEPWDDFWPTLPNKQGYQTERPWYGFLQWRNLHFWGILSSAALLSLGAPFWFNTLKTFTNLRSILANKQEKEQETSKQQKTS